ncbi:hypothetical protein CR513_50832, partial [Mucuna pruriens]
MWYFSLISRLKRFENQRDPTILCNPFDGEAWKHFDRVDSDFSQDPRNVRLGLCVNDFNPFVILTSYNLPPKMCMKKKFMFLTVLIPGQSISKHKIVVNLQPLIDELCTLWNDGVLTYDASYFDCYHQFLPLNHVYWRNKNSFKKRFVETSLIPPSVSSPNMFNRVSHLPFSYELQEEEEIFGCRIGKYTFYVITLMSCIQREMCFMNVFDTVMDINSMTNDTHNARSDMAEICNHKELELKDVGRIKLFKPKAIYTLMKFERFANCK